MLFDDEYKRKILSLIEGGIKTFTEIKKFLRIESNQLSYHLNKMVKEKFLIKNKKGYNLGEKGKTVMPYLRYSKEFDLLPMVSVGVFIVKNNKVLLLKRKWEPFKGYYMGVSGKLKRYEDIFEAAEKRVKELVSVRIKNTNLICINNFISQTHHFVMFFFRATTTDKPDQGDWIDLKKLEGNIFPETEYILKNFLNAKKPEYISSFFNDKTGDFKVFS
ncbi:MAG: NUDIX domain-containing protein [Nanoarchaeota archaeon]|nr:NUDIX domain-containing protein [Nanoarchaeota archaeon]MCG2717929.1 NUDIX domain-containing protein [Nanoarchaeota archaeon]